MARLLGRVIFLTLLALIPLTAIPYGTVEEWWETVFECAVFALAALWITEGMLSGKWFMKEHRLLVPLFVLLAFIFVQTIPFVKTEVQGVEVWRALSADPFETRLVAFRFLTLIIVAGLLLRYTSSRRRLRALIYVVVSTGVASALFGVVRQARQGEETGFLLPYLQPGRGYGQFINYNHFAFLMEMTLGLLTGLIVGGIVHHHRHRRLRLFIYSAALVLAWTALMLSRSRGGVFGMLGQVVFLGLMFRAVRSPHKHHKHRSRIAGRLQRVGRALAVRVILVAFLMIVMAFGLAWVGGEPLANRMGRLSDEVSEEELGEHAGPRRLHFWAATWKLFKARPVAGSGFGSYWVAIDGYYDDAGNSTPQQAHNDYLELLASGGLIGMALAVWFVFLFIRRARECLRSESSSRRAACFGALAGIFAIAIHSAVDFGLHATANALVFTTLIVIATVRCGDDEHSAEHRGGLKLASIFSSSSDLIAHLIPSRRIRRLIAVLVCLTACILGIWTVARIGLSRLHSDSAAEDRLLASADKAVRLTPSDPVAHFVRAGVLFEDEQFKGALDEYERAVALRPGDHVLWLGLGFARERNGDEQGALAAFGQAVRLAPYYASPRWQLGTFLLQTGQSELAFTELSRAAASDPELLPQAADLVWEESGGDPHKVQQVIRPETISSQLALARYFVGRGRLKEALELFRHAGDAATEERLALLRELLAEKRFIEAYEVWSSGRTEGSNADNNGLAVIINGGFEDDIDMSEQGFGWRLAPDAQAVSVYLDSNKPSTGSRSLHFEFNGNAPSTGIVSQLVLVEAKTRYRLSFAARTQNIVTGGLPVVRVANANRDEQTLGVGTPLAIDTDEWQDYSVEFTTEEATSAVLIEIRRQPCTRMPCPIYGNIWLDSFLLQSSFERRGS